MSAAKSEEVNPFAAPQAVEPRRAKEPASDQELRNEYLGGILLATGCGLLATLFLLASSRYPSSDLGEMVSLMSGWASLCLAIVSLMFVLITLRAAGTRVWRHLRILLGRR